jgi:hypothetical protein
MYRGQLGSVLCVVVIAVCLTSIMFFLSDIGRYFFVIEVMITKIIFSVKVIILLGIIAFIALIVLCKR